MADSVVLNGKVYIVSGSTANGVYSNKVFAADLNASVEGVYDLYRKDGDAPVGTPVVQSEYADGSVTASKMAEGAVSKSALDATILKYLMPEITTQPQASTIYAGADGSVSFSVEGKYLTYQWKKDGVDLTGETNATLTLTDANATLHDGNYSVVVSNDFGGVESDLTEVLVKDGILNGLVGWWRFDEGNGTVAYDSSGNGHDGNLTNGPTWTTGKIGGALSFDGVDDYFDLGNSDLLKNKSNLTTSLWLWTNETRSGNMELICLNLVYTTTIYTNNSKNHFNSGNGSNWYGGFETQGSISLSKWEHLATTLDSSGIKIFINGILDTTKSNNSIGASNYKTTFGAKDSGGSVVNCYKGLIDDVRIYDRTLSAAEVQALYNLGQ